MAQTQDTCWEICCTWLGLGCCIDEDEYRKQTLPEITQNKDRHCTDVPCLLFLIAVIVSEIVLISYAGSRGANIEWLTRGVDWNGQVCDAKNPSGAHAAWPDPKYPKIRVCVQDCGVTNKVSLPPRFVVPYESSAMFGAFCVPKAQSLINHTSNVALNSAQQSSNRAVADLNVAKWMIFGSVFVAIILSFVYLYVVACIGACLVWLTIVLVFAGGVALSAFLIRAGINHYSTNLYQARAELGIGIVLAIIVFCLMLSMLWMRKRIRLALALLDEASRAIRDVKGTLIFPIWTTLLGVGFMAFWIATALYVYSVSIETKTAFPSKYPTFLLFNTSNTTNGIVPSQYTEFKFDKSMQNTMIYHFVCLIFLMQVIIYYGFTVIAGTIADWYFSEWQRGHDHKKVRGNGMAELSNAPVLESAFRVCRFHIGTLAFGALLVTPIRILNIILTYLIAKTEQTGNKFLLCVLTCAKCCMKCFEWLINRVAQEGFIFMSIYGTNFCYSSITGVKIIWENAGRAAMVEGISKYMEIIGKAAITFTTTAIAFFFFKYLPYYQKNLSAFTYPGVAVFFLAYMISALFMLVFEVAIDALFLSFLIDESVNAGGHQFASDKLVELVGFKRAEPV